jgi:hypothetical protein
MSTPPHDSAWLSALADIIEPLPLSPWSWPWPPGWWLVAALLILLTLRALIAIGKRWRAQAYRRHARRRLAQPPIDSATAAAQLVHGLDVLRHAASAIHPAAANMQGERWRTWLRERAPQLPHDARLAELLSTGAYCPAERLSLEDAQRVHHYVSRWLKTHHSTGRSNGTRSADNTEPRT